MTRMVEAAGGIVWRRAPDRTLDRTKSIEVLLVHRPGYKDWTFPKGKAEKGEPIQVTAVREIEEETAMVVRLGTRLPEVTYRIRGGVKRVQYWCARPVSEGSFLPNKEIDKVRWMSLRAAHKKLTYDHDVKLLEAFEDLVAAKEHKTRTLLLLRHAKAVSREEFAANAPDPYDDLARPLADKGRLQAQYLASTIAAFGIRRIISSPATRCVDTVAPFAQSHGVEIDTDDRLAEGVSAEAVAAAMAEATATSTPTLVCSHRPTFGDIYTALGLVGPRLAPKQAPKLAPGQGRVLHVRKGRILSTELI